MLTVGVDLAASPLQTAACWIKWAREKAEAYKFRGSLDDEELIESFQGVDKVGLDVPFGWPDEFVQALAAYQNGPRWPDCPRRSLRFRATDQFVQERTRRWPLSVSSDRIAVPAMRAARLFSELGQRGLPVSREETGSLVEVYPAAALSVWGFSASGYKGAKGRQARRNLLAAIEAATGRWLHLDGEVHDACESSDDVLDALPAALVARAATQGLCEPPPEDIVSRAKTEGWIALPKAGSLDLLPSQASSM